MNNMGLRRFVPLKLKRKLAPIISNTATGYLLGVLFRNKIPFRGVIVDTSCESRIRRKTVSDLVFKIYERAEIDHVRAHLDGNLDVVELGGSIGVNSMQIRKKQAPEKRLFVIEADPELALILSNNFKINNLGNSVTVLNSAIDYSGKKTVSFSKEESNLSGKVLMENQNPEKKNTITVNAIQLSKVLEENSISEYVLVSDIEGMEIPIFIEDERALLKCKQIFIEIDGVSYKGKRYSVEDIISTINSMGYHTIARYHNCVAFQKNA